MKIKFNVSFIELFNFLNKIDNLFPIVKWLLGKETDHSLLNAKIDVLSCKDLVPVVLSTEYDNTENKTTTTVSYGIIETSVD